MMELEKLERDLSFKPVHNPSPNRLTSGQIVFYNEQGYVKPFRIYRGEQVEANRAYFDSLLVKLKEANDGRDSYAINGYHLRCRGIYDMLMNQDILDLVEDIIGPDIVCWGTHFFCKLPHDLIKVPWHQDASYWPFEKARTVTVWLAIDDADEENSAMQFLPGTHALGHLEWKNTSDPAVLNQEIVDVGKYGDPVVNDLKAGEISLHADMLAHGSEPNPSSRRRCGLTMRYCPPEVRAYEGWNEGAFVCRGRDPSDHWVNNAVPEGEDLTDIHKIRAIGG